MEQALVDIGTLRSLTDQCLSLFDTCQSLAELSQESRVFFEEKQAELKWWAFGLNVLHSGRSSLDTRVKEREDVRSLVQGLLDGLRTALEQCLNLGPKPDDDLDLSHSDSEESLAESAHNGRSTPASSDSSPSVESAEMASEDVQPNWPFSEQAYYITTQIRLLTRVSILIRKSGNAFRHKRADDWLAELERSGQDPYKIFKIYLSRHLRYGVLEHHMLSKLASGGNPWDTLLGELLESWIRSPNRITPVQNRLIEANVVRRNRIVYSRQSIERKISASPQQIKAPLPMKQRALEPIIPGDLDSKVHLVPTAPSESQSRPVSRPQFDLMPPSQTATAIGETVNVEALRSPRTSSATSKMTRTGESQDYPKCRISVENPQCPFCSLILGKEFAGDDKKWRGHVADDLSPYTCIFGNCESPHTLYATKSEWMEHMTSSHTVSKWVCSHCPDESPIEEEHFFDTPQEWRLHMETGHAEMFRVEELEILAELSERSMIKPVSCPLCFHSPRQVSLEADDHIAGHLHSFALLALPWDGDTYEDSTPASAGSAERNSARRSSELSDSPDDGGALRLKTVEHLTTSILDMVHSQPLMMTRFLQTPLGDTFSHIDFDGVRLYDVKFMEKALARITLWAQSPETTDSERESCSYTLTRISDTLYEALSSAAFLDESQILDFANSITQGMGELKKYGEIPYPGEPSAFLLETEQTESLIAAQAVAKAFIVRDRLAGNKKFFEENLSRVVKIQNFVRARRQREAYKIFTSGKNPSVGLVTKFVDLLYNTAVDEKQEDDLERMRMTVVQRAWKNKMLEQYVDQLDVKIALLVTGKIAIKELLDHRQASTEAATIAIDQIDIKGLKKSLRTKLVSYQQLLYNLQTQPQYLTRFFTRINNQGTVEKDYKRLENLLMSIFGYIQNQQEENHFLKLIASTIHEEITTCPSLQNYLTYNFLSRRLMNNYVLSPANYEYFQLLLKPLIEPILADLTSDLESDPFQIYKSVINNEEVRTGKPSQRPLDMPRELILKETDIRELFIEHLRNIRDICDQFLSELESLHSPIPHGVRFICGQISEGLSLHFRHESQQQLLQIVGGWLWETFLQPALVAPEKFDAIQKPLSPLHRRDIDQVTKVLRHIALGRQFANDNIYLQPLNKFFSESTERFNRLIQTLVSDSNTERVLNIDRSRDLSSQMQPKLCIRIHDVFDIYDLVVSEAECMSPDQTDILWKILRDLDGEKNKEMFANTTSGTFLTLDLDASKDPELKDGEQELTMETKKSLGYVIRIQPGLNLPEIFVKPVTSEDEGKWESFVGENMPRGSNENRNADMIHVAHMSYSELKTGVLENVMRVEKMGRISKHDAYQDILNAIALDICVKNRRRLQRRRELDGVYLTLSRLEEKAKYLEEQRQSHNDYINQAMAILQRKKDVKFLPPFTKQWRRQLELEQNGKLHKFKSLRYSARSLFDMGVLISWKGVVDSDFVGLDSYMGETSLTISCKEVGVFAIAARPGKASFPIEDLLQAQFENRQFIDFLDGRLTMNVNLLLHVLYKDFYR